jgi:MFS family permease
MPGKKCSLARVGENCLSKEIDMSVETVVKNGKKKFGLGDLLRIRDYRNLWLGQLISNLGDSMTSLALLLLVNELTGSTAALATMTILLTVPRLTFGLLAGVYVDRWNRKKIMIISDLLRGLFVLGFLLVNSVDQIWLLYVITFIQASIGTFFLPARSALIPNIVPKEGLMTANSVSQTTNIVMSVVGTGLTGFLVGIIDGYWLVFLLDAATFFSSLVMISLIRYQQLSRDNDEKVTVKVVFQQLRVGLKTTFGHRVLAGAIIAAGVTMLGLGMVNILLVPLIVNDLQIPKTWFGAIELSQTLAMIISGVLIAGIASRFKPTHMLSVGLILTGIGVGLMSLPANVWHVMIIIFVIGFFITPVNVSVQTIVQTAVPDEVRGRTSAANGVLLSSASVLSMAVAGVLADAIGVRTVFIVGGGFTILAGIIANFIFQGVGEIASQSKVDAELETVG